MGGSWFWGFFAGVLLVGIIVLVAIVIKIIRDDRRG